ncbi:SDR family NAD(P)-dependent oxidoreductase [Rhodovibrio salinarum]|uniref:NAD(P)-dependent oxidoreductase n=1 Tax=Rhodovibrio salinarum TaxID=1087 RepID=A0A934QIK9_9PROT|nr:SDR family oxidoreductase [Rhodovibrio salinarum]MBK1697382.1 NAD(P)-dependent oxidoreductase [Rhodovibrio salinarum]
MASSADAIYPSLQGCPVLVTGGASGIGEAIVRRFAGQGAKVGFLDIAVEQGQALAEELKQDGGEVHFVPCDLTDIEALREAVKQVADTLGPIRVLVNNAANDDRHDWREVTPEYWDARQAVNIRHQFFAIQAVAPGMIDAGGGSIINFGSISWMLGQGGMPGYTTAKSAVHGLTRSFARDLGGHGIRVNSVTPGWVMTQRQLDLWVTDESMREIEQGQVLKGHVQPDHLARMVLFLASDESAMCSAQNYMVDAGWL